MKYKRNKLLNFTLTLALVIGLMSGYSSTVLAESTYNITIQSKLTVENPGWNELTDGISATGTLDEGMTLVITASSDNGFNFVKSGDKTQKVSYDFRASSTDTPVTKWTFDTLSNNPTKQLVGINIADYSGKPYGTYTEKVTFTAKLEKLVDLSTLTPDYEAQDGDILINQLTKNVKITVAAGAHITLRDATISRVDGNTYAWAGITPNGDATITLEGDNTVESFSSNYPGIYIPENYTLTINGSGSLTATSEGESGICAENGGACGNITITETVTSVTATYSGDTYKYDAIGKGNGGTCGTVTIGGTVYRDNTSYQNDGADTIGKKNYTYTPGS